MKSPSPPTPLPEAGRGETGFGFGASFPGSAGGASKTGHSQAELGN